MSIIYYNKIDKECIIFKSYSDFPNNPYKTYPYDKYLTEKDVENIDGVIFKETITIEQLKEYYLDCKPYDDDRKSSNI